MSAPNPFLRPENPENSLYSVLPLPVDLDHTASDQEMDPHGVNWKAVVGIAIRVKLAGVGYGLLRPINAFSQKGFMINNYHASGGFEQQINESGDPLRAAVDGKKGRFNEDGLWPKKLVDLRGETVNHCGNVLSFNVVFQTVNLQESLDYCEPIGVFGVNKVGGKNRM